jgi:MOSC domain-containing protein YiiM
MRAVQEVRASPSGLEGDRYAVGLGTYSNDPKRGRSLTLVEAEVLEALRTEHGVEVAPGETRRNVTTRGIRLNDLVGRRFRIGAVLCDAIRLCEPCDHLVGLTGKPLLEPLVHRGGLRADVLEAGVIHVGDEVTPV